MRKHCPQTNKTASLRQRTVGPVRMMLASAEYCLWKKKHDGIVSTVRRRRGLPQYVRKLFDPCKYCPWTRRLTSVRHKTFVP